MLPNAQVKTGGFGEIAKKCNPLQIRAAKVLIELGLRHHFRFLAMTERRFVIDSLQRRATIYVDLAVKRRPHDSVVAALRQDVTLVPETEIWRSSVDLIQITVQRVTWNEFDWLSVSE